MEQKKVENGKISLNQSICLALRNLHKLHDQVLSSFDRVCTGWEDCGAEGAPFLFFRAWEWLFGQTRLNSS